MTGVWFDNDVYPTAVMGRQTITIEPVNLFVHLDDFDAECTGYAFHVASRDPPEVVIRAQDEGSVYLRILERGTDLLYDRLLISAHKASHVTVEPYQPIFWDAAPSTDLFYGGAPVNFVAQIYSGQIRLVDEDLTFEPADATSVASVSKSHWDAARVQATQSASSLSVRAMTADGTTGGGSALLAWEIDAIQSSEDCPWPRTVNVGESVSACFYGERDGRAVSGVPFTFRLYNPEGGAVPEDLVTKTDWFAAFKASSVGEWTLSVEGPGATRSFQLTVVEPPPSPPPPESAPENASGGRPKANASLGSLLDPLWVGVMRPLGGSGSPGDRAASFLAAPEAEPVRVDQQ